MSNLNHLGPRMRWNEESVLGLACFAYNREHSKHEHWGPGSSGINRHVFAMRAALAAIGYMDKDIDPANARRMHRPDE